MEYKSGNLYKSGGVGIFKYRKKYWFVLTRTHLQYYNSSEKVSNAIENILLSDIKSLTLIQKEAGVFNSTVGFTLEFNNSNKFVLQSDSISSVADWIIKIDGLVHSDDMSESFLDQVEKKQFLKILYKHNIKGGLIKTSNSDEEWNYSNIGSLSIDTSTTHTSINSSTGGTEEMKIDYHWDGEWLKSGTNSVLGYGRFNGVYLAWYQKDSKVPEIKYFWDEKEREYTTERKEFTFKWTRHFLASKYSTGEWIVEGHVPQPVVMFLQLIHWKRNPSLNNPFKTSSNSSNNIVSTPSSPSNTTITTTSSSGSGANSISPTLSPRKHHIPSSSDSSGSSPTQSHLTRQPSNIVIPNGISKASTIKIAPYTKGNAMLNVSNVLFNQPSSYDDSNNNHLLTSGSLLSSTSTSTTSSSSSSTHEELFVRISSSKSNSANNLAIDDLDYLKKDSLQFEEDLNLKLQSLSNNSSHIHHNHNDSLDNNINSPPLLGNIGNQSSTLDLLNDTINESSKIQTRLSTKLERVPSFYSKYSGSLNSLDSINSGILTNSPTSEDLLSASQQSINIQVKVSSDQINPTREINQSVSSSASTTSSIQSPLTTPLGSIIGPTSLDLESKSPTIINTTSNINSKHNDNGKNDNDTPNLHLQPINLLSKTQKKPLAKSTSSDKVTTIINQISSTSKKTRTSFCLACNLPITGPMVVAQGSHFHRECFKCNTCCKELGTKTFYRQSDNFVNQTLSPIHSSTNTSPSTSFNSSNLVSLSTSPSSPRGLSPSLSASKLTDNNNNNNNNSSGQKSPLLSSNSNIPKYLCETCFNDSCPLCAKCNLRLMYRCVNAMGKKWHPDHFTCKECQSPLVGSLYFEKDGFPYCQHDYIKLFSNDPNIVPSNNINIKPIKI